MDLLQYLLLLMVLEVLEVEVLQILELLEELILVVVELAVDILQKLEQQVVAELLLLDINFSNNDVFTNNNK